MEQQRWASPDNALDFTQIIFQHINDCRKARMENPDKFILAVETLNDLLYSYWKTDVHYKKELLVGRKNVQFANVANPFDSNPGVQSKVEYARFVFRSLLDLIQRSGFMPEKTIEGVLDEEVLDVFWQSIGLENATEASIARDAEIKASAEKGDSGKEIAVDAGGQ